MAMRIISGSARGTKLFTLDGTNTRPTLDRVKESVFNIIQNRIEDAIVLDLFAGSGAIGLEFLSRGAQKVVLCDNSKDADMYSTYLFLLSLEEALDYVNNTDNLEAVFYVDEDKIITSKGFSSYE